MQKGTTDSVFGDSGDIARQDDSLQVDYTTRQVVERIWSEHFQPRWRLVTLTGLAMAVSAGTTGAVPLIIKRAADEIFKYQNKEIIFPLTIAVIVITFLKTISEYISGVAVGYLGLRFIADLRIKMFSRLAHADLSWVEDVHSGRFIAGSLTMPI